jgi:hypothetical protein
VIARRIRTFGFAAAVTWAGVAAMVVGAGAARADDPDFLSFGAGYFDWNRQKAPAAEFRLEYRSDKKLLIFKPLGGIMGTSDGAVYAFAGIGVDVFLGRRIVLTPSFAPGYYAKGSGLDLGHELEFRSQIEFAYRFDDRSRLGVAVSHMSNASIADENPGTESAILYYSMPLSRIFGE